MASHTEQQRDALVERVNQAALGVFDLFSMYIGDRLGYYRALANSEGLTSTELAQRTGTDERYAREWIEQQTVTGILSVEDASHAAQERRYRLPAGHVEPLLNRESLNYVAPMAQLVVGVTRPMDELLDAYRTGKGIELAKYGRDFREGQGNGNRAPFMSELGISWLPALSDVHERLKGENESRIADIGCGCGWSAIAMAMAYPNAIVDGYDLDEPSILEARAFALEYGVSDRTRFFVSDASAEDLNGQYELVTALECVHDMSDPVGALKTMRRLAGETGTVFIGDEPVAETFTGERDDVERRMYGWSILHCLPVGLADQPSAATGTVMRTGTLRQYATEAGFTRFEVLPIDNSFLQFYRLGG